MARLLKGKQIEDGTIDLIKLNSASPSDVLFTTGTMIGITDAPTVGTDLGNKDYIDSVAAGLDPKESSRIATLDAIIGTYNATGGTAASGGFTAVDFTDVADFDLDGNVIAIGDRILVKNQVDAKQNGIYSVTTAGAAGVMERATDHDGTPLNEVSSGNFTFVELGATLAGTGWVTLGDGVLTLNTDDIDWVQFSESTSFSAGNGIDITSTVISADPDLVTMIATGGTGDQLEVLKVPNALTNGTGIATMTFDGSAAETIVIDNTGVAAAAYGSASSVATFTVNAQGQLTTAATESILITTSQISDYDTEQFVTGGTYSNATGDITFTNNLAGTFAVDLSTLDLNDTFTTATTVVGTTAYFDTTDGLSAYTLDLTSVATWSDVLGNGNTSSGNNATMTSGDVINSSAGSGELDLRNGGDNIVSLTNDAGAFTDSGIYISPDYSSIYSDGFVSVHEANPNLVASYISNAGVFVGNSTGNTVFTKAGIVIAGTATGSVTGAIIAGGDGGANTLGAIINSSGAVIAAGASNTVMIGGSGLSGGADNTVYVPFLNISSATTDNALTNFLVKDANGDVKLRTVASLGTDNFTTGSTLIGSTAYFDTTDSLSAYTLDLSALEVNDTFVTGGTYDNGTAQITLVNNDAVSFDVDLSAMDLNDTFSTGTGSAVLASDNSNTQSVDITGNTGFASYTLSLTDTFVTGGTYVNATGDITFTQNDASTFVVDLSSSDLNDTFTTGTTLIGSTAYFNTTDALSAYTLDLSSFAAAEKFLTGGTVSSGSLALDMNDATTVNVTGTIIQSVSGNAPITASTTSGAVTIGIDNASLQLASATKGDKDQAVTGATTGNNFDTGIVMAATPTHSGYVEVSVNGVSYIVGDATTGATADCYFSANGGTSAKAIEDIATGDVLFWNGTEVGFDLATDDNVDFGYEILQS